jgi:hypothetical protein
MSSKVVRARPTVIFFSFDEAFEGGAVCEGTLWWGGGWLWGGGIHKGVVRTKGGRHTSFDRQHPRVEDFGQQKRPDHVGDTRAIRPGHSLLRPFQALGWLAHGKIGIDGIVEQGRCERLPRRISDAS